MLRSFLETVRAARRQSMELQVMEGRNKLQCHSVQGKDVINTSRKFKNSEQTARQ